MSPRRLASWLLALAVAACGPDPMESDGPGGGGKADRPDGVDDPGAGTDVVSTALAVDLASMTARATVGARVAEGDLVLEAQGLEIGAIRGPGDEELAHRSEAGKVIVEAAPAAEDGLVTVTIDYAFTIHGDSDGLLAGGTTLTWPYHCGNLFPCVSAPGDGATFTLELTGLPEGATALYPAAIPAAAPSYMLAWATGDYASRELGATAAGTRVSVHWLPGGQTAALAGTRDLVAAFDWYERVLGPYTFGPDVASVAARWGAGAYGGMEHHPYWHVAVDAMDDAETHVHEAGHGWFGNGVRIACWEDFVLSEGTTSYLTARALGGAGGPAVEASVWADYRERLESAVRYEDRVALPEGCNAIDILRDGLFSTIPYMKGAFFYKAVADEVGAEALDAALGRFYRARVGTAVRTADVLDAIREDTGFDPGPLADAWLRGTGIPR